MEVGKKVVGKAKMVAVGLKPASIPTRLRFITAKPEELTWVSDDEFAAAQSYGLDKSRYNMSKSAFDTAKLLTLLFTAFWWGVTAVLYRRRIFLRI